MKQHCAGFFERRSPGDLPKRTRTFTREMASGNAAKGSRLRTSGADRAGISGDAGKSTGRCRLKNFSLELFVTRREPENCCAASLARIFYDIRQPGPGSLHHAHSVEYVAE